VLADRANLQTVGPSTALRQPVGQGGDGHRARKIGGRADQLDAIAGDLRGQAPQLVQQNPVGQRRATLQGLDDGGVVNSEDRRLEIADQGQPHGGQ